MRAGDSGAWSLPLACNACTAWLMAPSEAAAPAPLPTPAGRHSCVRPRSGGAATRARFCTSYTACWLAPVSRASSPSSRRRCGVAQALRSSCAWPQWGPRGASQIRAPASAVKPRAARAHATQTPPRRATRRSSARLYLTPRRQGADEARAARDRLLRRRHGYAELPIEELVALRRELPDYHKGLMGSSALLVKRLDALAAGAVAGAQGKA